MRIQFGVAKILTATMLIGIALAAFRQFPFLTVVIVLGMVLTFGESVVRRAGSIGIVVLFLVLGMLWWLL